MIFFLLGIKEYFLGTKNQYVATVAIDLGTVSSGFAYTLHTNQSQDAIFVNSDWVNEFGHRTSKTPTCLLLKPDLSFYAFGYKALEWNAYFQSTHETQDMLFFEVFKRDLHSDKVSKGDYQVAIPYTEGAWVTREPGTRHAPSDLRARYIVQ